MKKIILLSFYIYCIGAYLFGLVFYGYFMESYDLRPYEQKRLGIVMALAPVGIPALALILAGRDLALKESGQYRCKIIFGFCAPKK